MVRPRCWSLLGTLFVVGSPATAANLLVNPDFDSSRSLSGWVWAQESQGGERFVCDTGATCGAMRYSTAECCGQPASGSAASNSSFFTTESLSQCVPGIVAGASYDAGAWVRITSTPGFEPGLPFVFIEFHASDDCSDDALPSGAAGSGGMASAAWVRIGLAANTAPETAHSARLGLGAGPTGDSGSSVGMEFDGAFFGPAGTVPVELQSFEVE